MPGSSLSQTGSPISGSRPDGVSIAIILVLFFVLYEFIASKRGLYFDATGLFIPTPKMASIKMSYLSILVIRLSTSDSRLAISL